MSEVSQGAQLKWALTALIGGSVDLKKYGVSASAAYECWLIVLQYPEWEQYNQRAQAFYDLFGNTKTPNGQLYEQLAQDAYMVVRNALTN